MPARILRQIQLVTLQYRYALRGLIISSVAFAVLACDRHKGPQLQAGANEVVDRQQETKDYGQQGLSLMAQIGKKLFFEPSLSVSGKISCASCHVPENGFGPINSLPVQLGGPDLELQGIRATPNLTYLIQTPNFSVGPEDDGGTEAHVPADSPRAAQRPAFLAAAPPPNPARLARVASATAKSATDKAVSVAIVPQGGLFWDGRADTLQGQALLPLLDPNEMGNGSVDEIVSKLRRLRVIDDLKTLAGSNVATDSKLLMSEALFAIARYEAEEHSFAPYDSKYDQYLDGRVKLSNKELHGLKLFEDPKKGNCAACHPNSRSADGGPPAFTDYQYEALGVPRNADIKANMDPKFFDLGICGPKRTDAYARQSGNCGLFKTPSLRNVATRHSFFHNGIYHQLDDVIHFYVERDLYPEKYYPRSANGKVDIYNDLPVRYRNNIDNIDAPFDRKPGDQPALNDTEIQDLIAFLGTLTDGYVESTP
jgi:cytochrome c peroxidase